MIFSVLGFRSDITVKLQAPVLSYTKKVKSSFISFLASGEFCRLQITFANSLHPDQDGQNVIPVLDPNGLTLW